MRPIWFYTGYHYANDPFLGSVMFKIAIFIQLYIARRLTTFKWKVPNAVYMFFGRDVPATAPRVTL